MKLILASGSPRRRDLLSQIGLTFEVCTSQVDEVIIQGLAIEEQIMTLALAKALEVSKSYTEGLVIGADTVVVCEGRILGKPKDLDQAAEMLRALSGSVHQVMTAVAVVDAADSARLWQGVETTRVWFRALSEEDIMCYLAMGESMDKAGAYGIQGYGALLVEHIVGCYFNIVGLPLQLLAQGLKILGVDLYRYREY